MTDLARSVAELRAAVRAGDATAFVPLADALAESGHPDAAELCDLATLIVTADDWPTVYAASALFLTLIGDDR